MEIFAECRLGSVMDPGVVAPGAPRLPEVVDADLEPGSALAPIADECSDRGAQILKLLERVSPAGRLNEVPSLVQPVELLRDHLLDEGKLGPDSVGDVLGILSQALNRAVSLGLVARNVASKQLVTRPSGAAKTFRLIGPDLAREILGSLRDTEWEAAVNLALGTTLRREEILGLCWTDADLENRIVRIDRALTYAGGKVHLGEPKTAAGRRTVMLPGFVLDALKRAKAEQNKRRLLIGADWVERNLVVDRGDGDYWIPPSFSTGWRRFAAKAGFLDVPLLGLRHGSATLMLAAGVPDPVAAQIMGHADTRILRRYQDVVPELKREAASKMGELLGG